MKPVMIVGAAGVFGSRLAEELAARGRSLVLAGRSERRAEPLLQRLRAAGCDVRFTPLDRTRPEAAWLAALDVAAVVDAAGPFQGADFALPQAAIAAGLPYLDLADARDFVAGFPALDGPARAAGVALVTGASSTPALSHAVLDQLTAGWQRIDRILVAIAPGNRAPRGLSVTRAILAGVGRPVRLFREGRSSLAPGWSLDEVVSIEGVGPRHVALCETPDLDLLVQRFSPRVAAEFKAGLELGVMHHGLRLLGALRTPGLQHAAVPMRWLATALQGFGGDLGGMLVAVTGIDGEGRTVEQRWSLAAPRGVGPRIPVLPALALLERLGTLQPGAYSAAGQLRYDEILPHLARIGAEARLATTDLAGEELFARALGAGWRQLPEVTRAIHRATPSITLAGVASIAGAEGPAGRLVARLFGFPEEAANVPVEVVITRDGDRELWARHYPTRTMRSVMTRPDPARSTIEEWLGPFRFRLRLAASQEGIDLVPERVSWHGLPLPRWLLPRIAATERASPDSRHLFDVRISLWPFGRLVHYRGWLRPREAA